MLVAISDIHLTDGSTSSNVHPGAFQNILLPEIVSNAASKGAQEVNVVLMGDILDLMRTDYWTGRVPWNDRPWNGVLDNETGMNKNTATIEGHYNSVLGGILNDPSGAAFCGALKSIKPELSKELQKDIPVKVTYVVGNHDRAFNAFPSLQAAVKNQFSNVDSFTFQTSMTDLDYGVHIRHGHEWDEHNHGFDFYQLLNRETALPGGRFDDKCYSVQTIGEVVTSELMAGLIWRLKQNNDFPDEFVERVREVNNVRPMTDVFLWLEWFGRRQLSNPAHKQALLDELIASIESVLATELAKKWDDITPDLIVSGDLTDRLSLLTKILRHSTFDSLKADARVFEVFGGIFGSSKDDYVEGAKKEYKAGLSKAVQYVLYGHTHDARQDFFSGDIDGRTSMYINTGTYLPLIQRADGSGFCSAYRMTMAFFYRGDEDANGKKSPSMELWNGIKRKAC